MVKSNIKLTPYEDLFSSEESRQDDKRERIMELPLTQLQPFKSHPFHTKQDEELQKLADSIKEYGILTPLIARPCDSG